MMRFSLAGMLKGLTLLALLTGIAAAPAAAQKGSRPCSVASIAGNWMFATEVGQQALFPGQDGDITAIGTMNIDAEGNVEGVFDATVADWRVLPNIPYTGSVTVEPDCRGTLVFVTGAGTMRTDSIAVLNQSEMWGMSRDVSSLWTYRVRRISRTAGPEALAAKIDALLRRNGMLPSAYDPE